MFLNFFIKEVLNKRGAKCYGTKGTYTYNPKDNTIQLEGKTPIIINSFKDVYDYFDICGENPEIIFWGVTLQKQEIEKGYVSYGTLAKCGNLVSITGQEVIYDLYEQNGVYYDENDKEINFAQFYVIDKNLKEVIEKYAPTEYVCYCEGIGAYVWGITHWGTDWNYVSTEIKIEDYLRG